VNKVFLNSLPKAGTNLGARCLELLGYSQKGGIGSYTVLKSNVRAKVRRVLYRPGRQGYLVGIDTPVEISRWSVHRMLKRVGQKEFMAGHVGYTADFLNAIIAYNFSPILIVRDPRAVLNSFVYYVLKNSTHILHGDFEKMSVEDRYLCALKGFDAKLAVLQPLKIRCMALDHWVSCDRVLVIRFEDLVGAKGGGSETKQREAIRKVCIWAQSDTGKTDHVMEHLFGHRHTFRKGSVNSWESEIPLSVLKEVTDEVKSVLTNWGYEQ
jgi:hypothetical protein